jgi:hypothetical protein
MKVNYALVFGKISENPNESGELYIKHICVYEQEPTQNNVDQLVQELATDEEFGMVNDFDYNIYKFDRSNEVHADIMENVLELPLEITENNLEK